MIVVSGTQRSGTSMWMQVLLAGGFQVVGKPFISSWEKHFKEANPSGFYESVFRRGIRDHAPQFDARAAVKVFPPGVAATSLDRINHVIATMRDIREFVGSKHRFWKMEDVANPTRKPRVRHNPAIEWWSNNVTLLRDSLERKYPTRWVAYDRTLLEPLFTVQKVFAWLGGGDAVMGMQAIKSSHRTQFAEMYTCSVSTDFPFGLCIEWYQRVRHESPLSEDFVARVFEADARLKARSVPALPVTPGA